VVNWQEVVIDGQLLVCELWKGCYVNWRHFEMSWLFCPFHCPASPPRTVITLSFRPSDLSCSIPSYIPIQLVVSSFALLTIFLVSSNPFLKSPAGQCLRESGVDVVNALAFSCPSTRSVPVVPVYRPWLLPIYQLGARCSSVRSVAVICVVGRCLWSLYDVGTCRPVEEVGACHPSVRSVNFLAG